jgi:HlyD family secretion protein
VQVVRGAISATVSATGSILAEREVNLSFQAAGIVDRVSVQVGDTVTAGQELAVLERADLEAALRQAEIGQLSAEAQLRQLEAEPDPSDLAAAQAALQSAQASYQQLLAGADADQMAAAKASVDQARVAMEQAQQAYDQIKSMPNAGMMPQALQLQQATINYETAQAQFRVTTRQATEAQLAGARAQIAQAQASLDRLQRGANPDQLAVAQAAVDQARLTVDQARRRLENAELVAPWAGLVTMVTIVEGSPAQPGVAAVRLMDISRYHLDVQVDEVDIAEIAAGQTVIVEVDAFPDRVFRGTVRRVSPAAITSMAGAVNYQVSVDLDSTTFALRPGMSATATIVSQVREGVLIVANRAVQRDRESGKAYVERIAPGGLQRVEIRLGVRNDTHSEVLEGLQDGDRLAIRSLSLQDQIQQTFGLF